MITKILLYVYTFIQIGKNIFHIPINMFKIRYFFFFFKQTSMLYRQLYIKIIIKHK